MIVILYTTRYRRGGPSFEAAARTMARELAAAHPSLEVRCQRVESKAEVRAIFAELRRADRRITQLRFVLHAGMYGPMFGTTEWPEQFSPHEWRTLEIPFAEDGEAFFHACRSARWFAPFFARTFGVRSHGYHWYTAFSTDPERFVWPPPWRDPSAPLYVFGCPGNKSHGRMASLRKYTGRMPAEVMRSFEPDDIHGRASYDGVATDYDQVFDDIGVRHDEVRWLERRLDALGGRPRVLDLGCGNGALLQRLAPRIGDALGVDASAGMIEHARERCARLPRLRFERVEGPTIPADDGSFDVAISMLSFRYLDWDPLMVELRRVLRPQGRLYVIDMVDKPVETKHVPRMLLDKARTTAHALRSPGYRHRLATMVRTPQWQDMLRYNPMRALHEYEWYLGSRFPRGQLQTLNYGRRARVIAYDSGPFEHAEIVEMQYP
ncbi:class I SAM-dependent methyltransferase [Paraliomyxa miuraensis]|uniref:class I SAM-dependent methyltransferase n=1 Tax=Paraliomyxa miuraensis TaxID=376150 RepID=UPI0022542830|nr:class I SAM-dependent methyltransferase [Paraliomyxa miuraensis]MCX4246036.1 class I SAM-dependent methyltransferase [Paraliomyxa miuraensis]